MKRAVLVGQASAVIAGVVPDNYFLTKTEGLGHDVSDVDDTIVGSVRVEGGDVVVTAYDNQGKAAKTFMRVMSSKHGVRFTPVK